MAASATGNLSPDLLAKRENLLRVLGSLGRVAVAFSGGIDSTVVAKAAFLTLGDGAVAVTADSASVPRAELDDARRLADQIGIRHRIIQTEEFGDPDYIRNDGTRCYYCKSELYGRIETLLPELGVNVICSGANLDDRGDYRPGLKAAAEHAVRHPLQEAGSAPWLAPGICRPGTSRLPPVSPVAWRPALKSRTNARNGSRKPKSICARSATANAG